MTAYRNSNGEEVTLGAQLGGGGEGTVYAVIGWPEQAAKIWKSFSAERGEKIKIMVQNRPHAPQVGVGGGLFVKTGVPHSSFAWPDEALYGDGGKVAGFLMPKIDSRSFHKIFDYYNPQERQRMERARKQNYQRQDFLLLARNLSNAVARIHQAGYVIGDINESNIFANDSGQITIVDCDSMQVNDPISGKTYLCRVGTDAYIPPRLLQGGKSFADEKRSSNDDCFGLSVVIFQLLMQGTHPYQIAADEGGNTSNKTRFGSFPYRDNDRESTTSREYKTRWRAMEPALRRLFRDAFAPDYESSRPSAEEWATVLDSVINPRQGNTGRADNRQHTEELNRQLAHTRNDLQSKDVELQQTRQQLQAANRKLDSTNFRLRDALGVKDTIESDLKAEQKAHRKTRDQLEDEKQKHGKQERKAEQQEREADRRRLFWMLPILAGASAIVGAGVTAILFLL